MVDQSERSWVARAFVNGREGRLRAGWRLLVAVVGLVVASVVAAIPVVLLEGVLATTGVAGISVGMVGQFLSYVALTGVLVALAWFVDRRTVADLGLGGGGWRPNLVFGLVLGVVMTSAVFAVELAAGLVTVEQLLVSRPGFGGDAALPFALALPLTFLFFVAVGVGEELVLRGYLMTNLAEGLNGLGPVGPRGAIGVAAVVTSGLFGALHLANPNITALAVFNIAVVGLFFAWAYVVTDDLGIPIGVHVTWNFSLSSLYGFPVSGLTTPATVLDVRQTGDPLVTGGEFGPEAGLVVYLALAVAVGLTWWWVRRTEGPVGFPVDVAVPDLRTSPGNDWR